MGPTYATNRDTLQRGAQNQLQWLIAHGLTRQGAEQCLGRTRVTDPTDVRATKRLVSMNQLTIEPVNQRNTNVPGRRIVPSQVKTIGLSDSGNLRIFSATG